MTLWSLGVFFVIHVTVAALWTSVYHSIEISRIDRQLESNATTTKARSIQPNTSLRSKSDLDLVVKEISKEPLFQRYSVQIWTDDGELYTSSSGDESFADVQRHRPTNTKRDELETVGVQLKDGTDAAVRILTRPFQDETGQRYHLQLATPAPRPIGEQLGEFLVLSLPIGLLAAGLMAWFMAGRVVSPIQRLAKAARAVSPTNLKGRIEVNPADSETARLQSELNDALERLEKGYRAQNMFISNVSHELKTPIAVLLSQAQVLKQEDRSPLEYRRFLAVVEEEMRILGRLVESFLVLARIGHGKEHVRRERATVNDVVLEAAEHCAGISRLYEVPLVTILHLGNDGDIEPELEGDPELLRTMLENLVRNALRFSPRGEPVDLRVSCTKDRASITVRDRGPGIPREHIEKIFERFYQVQSDSQNSRGSGLGLAIAKSVAELHNGTISVRNCSDRGCEFEVLVPLGKNAGGAGARGEERERNAERDVEIEPAQRNAPKPPKRFEGLPTPE
jgi:signal transduction histidine kinase